MNSSDDKNLTRPPKPERDPPEPPSATKSLGPEIQIAIDLDTKSALELELQQSEIEKKKAKTLEKQLQEEREKYSKQSNELSCLRDANNRAESERIRLEKTVEELREKKDELEMQLSAVKLRLSKEIGDKVSNANPDLADLSDSKRPTKIGEMYQELYDNQWTDAFETAVKRFTDTGETNPERSAITLLLTILKDCYKVCAEEYETQAKLLVKLLATDKRDLDASSDLKKRFKAARRINAKRDASDVCEKYLASLNADKPDERIILNVKAFVDECVDVCWMMVIQDPQVVLHKEAVQFDKFNSNLYKAYTVSGKKVDFVVWPALLLHTEGAPLAKGIAQCVKEADDSSHVRCVNERNMERAPSPCEGSSSNVPNAKGGNKGRAPSPHESPKSDVPSAKEGKNGRAPNPQEGTHKVVKIDQNKNRGTEGKLEGKNEAESAANADASIKSERGKNDNTKKMFTDTNDAKDYKQQKQENQTSQVDKESPEHRKVSAKQESKKHEKQHIENTKTKETRDAVKGKNFVKGMKARYEC